MNQSNFSPNNEISNQTGLSAATNKRELNFSSIYCLKAIGAFFVICIHCYDPWQIFPIIRTAVPFFLMISGFFLYKDNLKNSLDKCKNAFKKIFWLTVYANIFYYLVFYVPHNIIPLKSVKSIIEFIAVGSSLGFHLWYLNAYLETLLIVIIALHFNILKFVWYTIPFFIILGLICGKYEFVSPDIQNYPIFSPSFLTIGIPCFGIGWLARKYSSSIMKFLKSPLLITLIIAILSECEVIYLKSIDKFLEGEYLITTFPLAALMLLVAVKYPQLGNHTLFEYIGKKYSTYIYIFHLFILEIFVIPLNKFLNLPSVSLPFIVFFLTTLFVVIWKKCSKSFI